jgi:S1-C subfamily serine protease
VIVDSSGIVVTNNHVIKDADEIKVALSDGREFESKLLLRDETTDLAVLKIEAKDKFPVLGLGNSDDVEVGDLVLAIGNPFGVGQTVTSGIVSAQSRTQVGISDFDFFIQTDAAINPAGEGATISKQFFGAAITIVYTAIATAIILYVVKAIMGLRPSKQAEIEGLDIALHGESVQ